MVAAGAPKRAAFVVGYVVAAFRAGGWGPGCGPFDELAAEVFTLSDEPDIEIYDVVKAVCFGEFADLCVTEAALAAVWFRSDCEVHGKPCFVSFVEDVDREYFLGDRVAEALAVWPTHAGEVVENVSLFDWHLARGSDGLRLFAGSDLRRELVFIA